jgi:hypothetical protein
MIEALAAQKTGAATAEIFDPLIRRTMNDISKISTAAVRSTMIRNGTLFVPKSLRDKKNGRRSLNGRMVHCAYGVNIAMRRS